MSLSIIVNFSQLNFIPSENWTPWTEEIYSVGFYDKIMFIFKLIKLRVLRIRMWLREHCSLGREIKRCNGCDVLSTFLPLTITISSVECSSSSVTPSLVVLTPPYLDTVTVLNVCLPSCPSTNLLSQNSYRTLRAPPTQPSH